MTTTKDVEAFGTNQWSGKIRRGRNGRALLPKGAQFQFLGHRPTSRVTVKSGLARQRGLARKRRGHDPLLVLNMAEFNFSGGWERIFDPIRTRSAS